MSWLHLNVVMTARDDAPPNSLINSITNLKVKTMEVERVGVRYLIHSNSRVEGCVGVLRWGLG
jgi:hypothetical protein